MTSKKTILTVVILLLVAGNILLGVQYFSLRQQLDQTEASLETYKMNEEILEFMDLFINRVLKAEGEIDFDTRLKLENAVRELEDQEILEQWQQFTNSDTEAQAQEELKDLLDLLIQKIKIQ